MTDTYKVVKEKEGQNHEQVVMAAKGSMKGTRSREDISVRLRAVPA